MGSLSKLTRLYLGTNELSGEIPPELGSLSNLTHLGLSRNILERRDTAGDGNLANLTLLGLSENQLSGEIPAWLGSLSNLRSLDLTDNELSGCMPSDLEDQLNMEYSDLGDSAVLPVRPRLTRPVDDHKFSVEAHRRRGPVWPQCAPQHPRRGPGSREGLLRGTHQSGRRPEDSQVVLYRLISPLGTRGAWIADERVVEKGAGGIGGGDRAGGAGGVGTGLGADARRPAQLFFTLGRAGGTGAGDGPGQQLRRSGRRCRRY